MTYSDLCGFSAYVAVDLETTGLYANKGDTIIEIAALKDVNDVIVDEFVTFVNPHRPLAPFIVGLRCFEPIAPPGSVYKILRKDTIVYVTRSRPQLHVSEQCPLLRYAYMIYRGTYEKARYEDFYRMYRFCDSNLAQYHIPPICPTCVSFTPNFFGGASILKIQDL